MSCGARVPTLLPRPLSTAEAGDVAAWSYQPPFDVQDTHDPAVFLRRGADGDGYYPAVDDAGRLVAFAVLGAEARVLGQEPTPGVVDVGTGVRPDATSQGLGTANERSRALCRGAGSTVLRDSPGPGGRPFRELVRILDAS